MNAIYVGLPFPPSVNDSVEVGRSRKTGKAMAFSTDAKRAFVKEADGMFLQQKRALAGRKIEGLFTYHLTLNRDLRGATMDGDNRQKYALDYLQRVGIISNDKFAEGGSWAWGPCEYPALIGVFPFDPDVKEPVPHRVPATPAAEREQWASTTTS